MAIEISNSVGFEGANVRQDVITIQNALNRIPAHQGGPQIPLAVDGLCGPRLIAAIGRFQAYYLKFVDLRINKKGVTLPKLISLLNPSSPPVSLSVPVVQRTSGNSTNQPQGQENGLIIGRIINFQGECYLNRQELTTGQNPVLRRGTEFATGSSGRATVQLSDGSRIELGPNTIFVALGRSSQIINAGIPMPTRVERGSVSTTLSDLSVGGSR